MSLIAILIAAATERYWRSFQALRPFQSLVSMAGWMHGRWGGQNWFKGPGGVLLVVAPGVVAIALLQYALSTGSGVIAWLVTLIFSVLVLALCIGHRSADTPLDDYQRALEREDAEGAYLHVRELLHGREADNPAEMNRMVIETLLVRNHERLLAILFWFVLLGPVGAVLYRSTAQLKGLVRSGRQVDENFIEAALRLQALLDWVPARITAFCYGIIGSFVDAIQQWRTAGPEWSADMATGNRGILINTGIGSLRQGDYYVHADEPRSLDDLRTVITETRALIQRAVIVWITGFALLTIAGWVT